MRATIFIGVILIALGGTALFVLSNGFFLFLLGQATYWPPEEPEAVESAFVSLASERGEAPGTSLGGVAEARVKCAAREVGFTPSEPVAAGFKRLNLVILGAGTNSRSSVIPPDARRLTELRRDLTQDARDYREPELNERESAKLEAVLQDLVDRDHKIYTGLDLSENFGHLDLSAMSKVLLAGGEKFYFCVEDNRL